jgi:3-deoxy-manno-octulosonate cytidylyltransferase (CMP-KDO synthetase)
MTSTENILGIIPARMASVRFPGKPLANIGGVPMVIRVYRQASTVLPNLYIASGDREIGEAAREYGARFILTNGEHPSGTSRCIEAAGAVIRSTGHYFHSVINIQGDEPMVAPEAVAALAADISAPENQISTLYRRENDPEGYRNPNRVKVVLDLAGNALYFSRAPVPHYRDGGSGWLLHVGMYAFKTGVLEALGQLRPGFLERVESLEQLRWLENGYRIHCIETAYAGSGIDTPEDLSDLLASGLVLPSPG